jgi:hypothetical protein
VTAILNDKSGKDVCRNFFLVKKWKHITLSNPRLSLRLSKNKNSLLLKTNKPTFFVSIYHPKYTLSDQGFFILPNEEFEVVINEKQSDEITKQDFNFYHLNNYLLSN